MEAPNGVLGGALVFPALAWPAGWPPERAAAIPEPWAATEAVTYRLPYSVAAKRAEAHEHDVPGR
jgi:hypothetical protein